MDRGVAAEKVTNRFWTRAGFGQVARGDVIIRTQSEIMIAIR